MQKQNEKNKYIFRWGRVCVHWSFSIRRNITKSSLLSKWGDFAWVCVAGVFIAPTSRVCYILYFTCHAYICIAVMCPCTNACRKQSAPVAGSRSRISPSTMLSYWCVHRDVFVCWNVLYGCVMSRRHTQSTKEKRILHLIRQIFTAILHNLIMWSKRNNWIFHAFHSLEAFTFFEISELFNQ